MTPEELEEQRSANYGLVRIAQTIKQLRPQLIILDELAVAMRYNLVPRDKTVELMKPRF